MLLTQDQNTATYQIQSFEPGRIQVNRQWLEHSILICQDACLPLEVKSLGQLTPQTFKPLLEWDNEIVLLGTGPNMLIPPAELLAPFYEQSIGIEFMDSYAACRTYSVLTSESRKVGAIILAFA